ncbi:hypothetical protein ACIPSJ_27045 [Streptomyces sp. NPDC090088]|uniref:hypothetical protein n=1 Tax=Streptomyces sp. NPDC090088 TaxID=3365944 RepID=UPI003822CD2A
MALLCYRDLDDEDHTDASTLHASLQSWVLGLLSDTQDRATRLPARFAPHTDERAPRPVALALQTILFIRYAQEQLLDRNAFLRYLCPDCPRDGQSRCPARDQSRPPRPGVHKAVCAVPVEPMPLHGRTWLAQTRPAASRVFERLRRLARQRRESTPDGSEQAARELAVRHLYEMARMWRTQGLPDEAVNVDGKQDGYFVQDVMGALMLRGHDRDRDTDARHSPVNFIAVVLHTLTQQLGAQQAFTTREAVMAALVARNACIEGDTAAVDEFSRTWLGLSRPKQWRSAVEMALLGGWVDALGRHLSNDAEIMELLHRHTDREHRCLQPLWERKSSGRRVRLLDDPVTPRMSLRDLITDHRRPEDQLMLGEVEDPRVQAVLTHLAPAERAVAMAYAMQRMTWAQAAAEGGAGNPDAFGERVRRKLKRLGAHRSTANSPAPAPVADR